MSAIVRPVRAPEDLTRYGDRLTREAVKQMLASGGHLWEWDNWALVGVQPMIVGGWLGWLSVVEPPEAVRARAALIRAVRSWLLTCGLHRVEVFVADDAGRAALRLPVVLGLSWVGPAQSYLGPGHNAQLYEFVTRSDS